LAVNIVCHLPFYSKNAVIAFIFIHLCNMRKFFLTVAYKGTAYHGWQKQPNAVSVQEKIETSLSTLLQTETAILGSGRTDTGVHATAQVFQLELPNDIDISQIVYRLNKLLPHDIAVSDYKEVNEDTHARFDAVSRSYEYHINTKKNAFTQDLSYYFTHSLDVPLMNEAAESMKAFTDFESFSKVKTDVNTFNCEIFEAIWKPHNELLVFHVSANRFLRGMVRTIVGTLLEVGLHNLTVEGFKNIIESKDRKAAGRSVPAHGLFLTSVKYPQKIYKAD
jgi:tRNA pseudouridine38-40 synthase